MINRQDIVAAARRWIGVRWQHQGRSHIAGIDCIGLVVKVAEELALPVEDILTYRRRQDGRVMMSEIHKQLQVKSITNWKEGDIGVFKESSFPIHVGILALDGEVSTVIHAHARRRQVIEEPLAPYGGPFAVFTFPEVV